MNETDWATEILRMLVKNVKNPELRAILAGCKSMVEEHAANQFLQHGVMGKPPKPPKEKRKPNPEDIFHARDLPKTLTLDEVSDFLDHKARVGVQFWREYPKEWYVNYLQETHKIEVLPWN